MAGVRRSLRVGDLMQREIADLLMSRTKDPRVEGVTVTGVRLSRDLRHARVYFSVLGGEEEIARAQAGLDSARGFIKREIGGRMDLKYVPEILFEYDPSLERGSRMEKVFEKLRAERKSEGGR